MRQRRVGRTGKWGNDPGKETHNWEVLFLLFCNLTGDSFPTESPSLHMPLWIPPCSAFCPLCEQGATPKGYMQAHSLGFMRS